MKEWFECSVECITEHEQTASVKREKQNYLIDAMSFTEAEARMIEKINEFPRAEYRIKKLNVVKFEDIYDDGDYLKWWKVKISYKTETDSGKVKNISTISLVKSDDTESASRMISEKYKTFLAEWEIKEIKEYNLSDYYPYQS